MASQLALATAVRKRPSTAVANVTSRSADEVKQIRDACRADRILFTLRKSISSLTSDLGNPFYFYMRMATMEQQGADSMMVDAYRRRLNTILLGRVGLNNGRAHVNKLIAIFKYIKDHYEGEQIVHSRVLIDLSKHFEPIFTPHRQPDYKILLREYAELRWSDKLPKLTFDTTLMLSDDQQESANCANASTSVTEKEKPSAMRAEIKAPAKKIAKKRKVESLLITEEFKIWNDKCEAALKAILENMPKSESDFGEASMLWSRECEKILKKCVRFSESLSGFKVQLLPLMSLAQKSQLSGAMCTQLQGLLNELCNKPKKKINKKVQKKQPRKAKK